VISEPVRPKDSADTVRPAPNLEAIDIAVSQTQSRDAD
jgi:hypothetical protein